MQALTNKIDNAFESEEVTSGKLLHQLQVRSFGGKSSKQGTGITTVPSMLFSMVNLSISGMTHGYRGTACNTITMAHRLCWGPPHSTMLCTLIVDGKWQKPFRWLADLNHLWEEILEIEVGGEGPDILIWSGANSWKISYNSAWHEVRAASEALSWTKELWHPIQPPRMSFLC
ncbi:hypothetical protein QJS04_geneDACA008274 [Acorus gramineus]|uniref:Uncharacterized protein n=1 Tax=Acorus gramineus TaxID=55184 RepID=A0AAV9AVR0_ACOGR|nr:hypothetical protein QJS04_geneDACA008274 [Acorus gramineus]